MSNPSVNNFCLYIWQQISTLRIMHFDRAVPSAVFSQPPIGQVGLTEEKVIKFTFVYFESTVFFGSLWLTLSKTIFFQAIEKYGDVDVYTSNFKPLRATLSGLPDRVYMKVIVCAKTNKVLGVHMCGEDAPEIIQVCVWFSFVIQIFII